MLCSPASPVHAQTMMATIIGNTISNMVAQGIETRCIAGEPMSNAEIAEAQTPAIAGIQAYWLAFSGSDVADVSALFQPSGKSRWVAGEVNRQGSALKAVSDPITRTERLEPTALTFFRAGDGKTASGVWAIGSREKPAGFYHVDFSRPAGIWKISRFEVLGKDQTAPSIVQYCHKAGDVEAQNIVLAKAKARREARDAKKALRNL